MFSTILQIATQVRNTFSTTYVQYIHRYVSLYNIARGDALWYFLFYFMSGCSVLGRFVLVPSEPTKVISQMESDSQSEKKAAPVWTVSGTYAFTDYAKE